MSVVPITRQKVFDDILCIFRFSRWKKGRLDGAESLMEGRKACDVTEYFVIRRSAQSEPLRSDCETWEAMSYDAALVLSWYPCAWGLSSLDLNSNSRCVTCLFDGDLTCVVRQEQRPCVTVMCRETSGRWSRPR